MPTDNNLSSLRRRLAEQIFNYLAADDGILSLAELTAALSKKGILEADPRLPGMLGDLLQLPPDQAISVNAFEKSMGHDISLLDDIFNSNLIIPDFINFCRGIETIFNDVKQLNEGQVANYIPELASIDPSHFAVSVCTIDGQRFNLGDHSMPYSVQSTCKPINYCLALEENGEKKVHQYIGREASGHGFNELKLDKNNRPHNPMLNAGAIMACALIQAEQPLLKRCDYLLDCWQTLCGGSAVNFNEAIYLSEKATADRNFALAYFMNEKKIFPAKTDLLETLDYYFRCCSIEVTTQQQAILAATLANGGCCPFSENKLLKDSTVKNCLSLMSSCGMYDYSGEFNFGVGLPAKSAVSGALLLVVPNVLGMAIWSPAIDGLGNSVRGVAFAQRLVERYNFHIYDSLIQHSAKFDPRRRKHDNTLSQIAAICWAAYYGDLGEVKRLLSQSNSVANKANYDGRTALHLAACEGHIHVVRCLLNNGANVNARDRWGHTALTEAKQAGHTHIVELLLKHQVTP